MKSFSRRSLIVAVGTLLASAAYGQTYSQLVELTGSAPGTLVSFSVAISGSTLVIGAPHAGPGGNGAVYVYTAGSEGWSNPSLTAMLTQDTESSFGFGYAVAISGNTIVVGGYDPINLTAAVYIYVGPSASGSIPPNAELSLSGTEGGTFFSSVAIDGGTVVAGLPSASGSGQGAAYVYVEPPGGWRDMTQTAELAASRGSSGGEFGNSVSISGRTIAVGAPRSEVGTLQIGRAYVFVEPAAGWSGTQEQTTELGPSNGVNGAYFGNSVSVSSENVAVGAPGQSVGSNQGEGAVYIYSKPSAGWPNTMTETAEITARNGTAGGQFGDSVAISGTGLAAGAPGALGQQGLVYLFREPSGGWKSGSGRFAVAASDGAPDNSFGNAVGVGDGVLAVSASGWPSGSGDADGAVYVFGPAG
jgi:hypothetical protein